MRFLAGVLGLQTKTLEAGAAGDLVGFVEYDGDSSIDVLTSDGAKTFEVYSFKDQALERVARAEVGSEEGVLQSVLPLDWTLDGLTDFIAVMRQGGDSIEPTAATYACVPFRQAASNGGILVEDADKFACGSVEPFLADVNLDGYADLVGQAGTGAAAKRTVWLNGGPSKGFVATAWEDFVSDRATGLARPLLVPHSSAYVDVNGDCLADFAFTVTADTGPAVEIWLQQADGKYGFDSAHGLLALPKNAGQVSWIDLNADGTTDILVPLCPRGSDGVTCVASTTEPMAMFATAINMQPKGRMCDYTWNSGDCRAANKLCVASAYSFGEWSYSTLGSGATKYDFVKAATFIGQWWQPAVVSMGDLAADGYPDAAVVLQDMGTLERRVCVMQSCPCEGTCNADESAAATYDACRKFVPLDANCTKFVNSDTIAGAMEITATALYDGGGTDGLEILMWGHKKDETTTWGYNLYMPQIDAKDHYHIKAMSLSGICGSTGCDESEGNDQAGLNYPGATFKITVTDVDGVKMPRIGTQFSQTAYRALQLPSVYFGLGRTNNYVEEFYLGIPTKDPDPHYWVSIIPNTAVIAIPYPRDSSDQWTLDLVVSPSKQMWLVFSSVVGMLLLTAGMILILEQRERREDQRKQQKHFYVHFINA